MFVASKFLDGYIDDAYGKAPLAEPRYLPRLSS